MLSIAGLLLGGVKDFFINRQKIGAAKAENTARLLSDKTSNNHEWEMATLMDKDKWMRRISFCMFTWPFIWVYFDPIGATEYFKILDLHLPEWYKQTYMGMTGGIWGISALKNAVPSLVGGIAKSIRK
jgi:hypothetical protein|tara:strand:+ start:194 stop:577 length:384 start_codon:yes stop_codon:yes gene_type:complete